MSIDKMLLGALSLVATFGAMAGDLVIATVNYGHMIEMQKHTAGRPSASRSASKGVRRLPVSAERIDPPCNATSA